MTRAKLIFDIAVIFGALILVLDDQADWCAGCFAFENAGSNFNAIAFAALGGVFRLSRFTLVQPGLDVFSVRGI